jgi:hypothetical protein
MHENMLSGSSAAAPAKLQGRSRVSNGKSLWLDGDRRSVAARRFRDIFAGIISDLGGADLLSEGQKQLARRCSLLSVECEQIEARAVAGDPIDLEAYGVMTDRLGRAFMRLGLERRQRDALTLEQYAAEKYGKPTSGLPSYAEQIEERAR